MTVASPPPSSVHAWRLVFGGQQEVYCCPCGVGQATCSEEGWTSRPTRVWKAIDVAWWAGVSSGSLAIHTCSNSELWRRTIGSSTGPRPVDWCVLRYGLKRKQFVSLIYLIYLDHWHSKTTTADKCVPVNKLFTHSLVLGALSSFVPPIGVQGGLRRYSPRPSKEGHLRGRQWRRQDLVRGGARS